MYLAHIEVTMLDAETAEWLSTDPGWLDAMYAEAVTQATNAGKTVTGTPELYKYTLLSVTDDGSLYDFEFKVPIVQARMSE